MEPSHKNSVALIANGEIHDYVKMKPLIMQYEKLIAVDGGLIHCDHMDIVPDLIIGDFDSTPPELLDRYSSVQKLRYPINKDHSDLELAYQAANQHNIERIGIFGAVEKRTDHALSNLFLLAKFPKKTIVETDYETIVAVTDHYEFQCEPGQTVSIIPLGGEAFGVTTQNLKWELYDAHLDYNFISLSNICLKNSFSISVKKGVLLSLLARSS